METDGADLLAVRPVQSHGWTGITAEGEQKQLTFYLNPFVEIYLFYKIMLLALITVFDGL